MADGGDEYSGKSVDDAIAQAEHRLGVHRSDLDIVVLSYGSRGVFGIGAEAARIRARRQAPVVEPEPVLQPSVSDDRHEEAPEDETIFADVEEQPAAVTSATEGTTSPARTAVNLETEATEILQHLLQGMGIQADISVRPGEDDEPLTLAISGEGLGVLIGRRGDNLAALQFMVNLILSKNRRQWPRVIVDVENYRARRESSLKALAGRIAYKVQRTGRAFTLEAMPASDRRIIHLTLRDHSSVETYSIGEGVARRVVVAPKQAPRSNLSSTR